MTILQIQRMAARHRELAQKAFVSCKHRDANQYEMRQSSFALSEAIDSYVTEIKRLQTRRASVEQKAI
jgi:hypothetical protein